eukprot:TRINITY_DN1401_c0_g1_i1.p1 TRINITY_DN1401_c0_g1~~TRINITY_DN1401_c0_g1_i1.p1  ORF type:complete len:197 (+),score=30.40 TRINITY_DN1401_c0_g1_i1:66-656(+)
MASLLQSTYAPCASLQSEVRPVVSSASSSASINVRGFLTGSRDFKSLSQSAGPYTTYGKVESRRLQCFAAAAAEVAEERAEVAAIPRVPAGSEIPKQKIRIKLRCYLVEPIQQACEQILAAARSTGAGTMGPVPLPTHRRLYCLLRSPHVNKNSMEHFQIKTHKRLIDLVNPNAQTIDALMQLDLPAGVDVEVKLS